MICTQCNTKEVDRGTICSTCRSKNSRAKKQAEGAPGGSHPAERTPDTPKPSEPTQAPTVPPTPLEAPTEPQESQKKHDGHWIGKPPHKPIWSSCANPDCKQRENPEPDWTPTCEKPCCAV